MTPVPRHAASMLQCARARMIDFASIDLDLPLPPAATPSLGGTSPPLLPTRAPAAGGNGVADLPSSPEEPCSRVVLICRRRMHRQQNPGAESRRGQWSPRDYIMVRDRQRPYEQCRCATRSRRYAAQTFGQPRHNDVSKLQCVYEDQIPPSQPQYTFIEEQPGHLGSAQGSESSASVTISSERLQSIEDRVDYLTGLVKTLQARQSTQSESEGRPNSELAPSPSLSPSANEPPRLHAHAGQLFQYEGGRARYVEPTFWAAVCREVEHLNALLHPSTATPSASSSSPESGERPSITHFPAYRAGRGSLSTRHTIFDDVPARKHCDVLLDGYVHGYHPLTMLVHMPTFHDRYLDFWTQRRAADESQVSTSFVALLMSMLYAGSLACPDRITEEPSFRATPSQVSSQLKKVAVKAVKLANYPRAPTLDSFVAYLITQNSQLLEEEPLSCVALCGLALRTATMLGLHKDPSHFPGMNPIEAEMRRRIWWHLVYIDVSVAMAAGLPPIIDASSWDVQGVSDLKEQLIGTPEGMKYESDVRNGIRPRANVDDPTSAVQDSMVSTSGILVQTRSQYSIVMRRNLARLMSGPGPTIQDIVKVRYDFQLLGAELISQRSRIPEPDAAALAGPCIGSTYQNNPGLNRWLRLIASAHVDDKFRMISNPIIHSLAVKLWPDIHREALYHDRLYVMKTAHLAAIDDFRHFQWSWPGQHQPLHALSIILLDLILNPNGTDAAQNRLAVEVVFALCGPEGGMVAGSGSYLQDRHFIENGSETWTYMRRLRTAAWNQAGLDPSIGWTRQEALNYCRTSGPPETVLPDPRLNAHDFARLREHEDVEESPNTIPGAHDTARIENMVSPTNIDWALVDAVLEEHEDQLDSV